MSFLQLKQVFFGLLQPRVLKIGIYDLWVTLQNRTFGFFEILIFLPKPSSRVPKNPENWPKMAKIGQKWPILNFGPV